VEPSDRPPPRWPGGPGAGCAGVPADGLGGCVDRRVFRRVGWASAGTSGPRRREEWSWASRRQGGVWVGAGEWQQGHVGFSAAEFEWGQRLRRYSPLFPTVRRPVRSGISKRVSRHISQEVCPRRGLQPDSSTRYPFGSASEWGCGVSLPRVSMKRGSMTRKCHRGPLRGPRAGQQTFVAFVPQAKPLCHETADVTGRPNFPQREPSS
jgi:hypothetical protein